MVQREALLQVEHRKGGEDRQGDHLLDRLQFGGRIDLVADAVRRHREPVLEEGLFFNSKVIKDLDEFKKLSDVIVANRMNSDLNDVKDKVYTRDLFNSD